MRAIDIKAIYRVNKCYQLTDIDKGYHFITNYKHASGLLKHFGDTSNQIILEVGSGPGAMTRRLLAQPSLGVLGVEADTKYNSYLESIRQSSEGKFQWINTDILKADESVILQNAFPQYKLRSPWDATPYVTAIINISFADVHSLVARYCVDLSRRNGLFSLGRVQLRLLTELTVAERICAPSGDKEFSSLSPLVQNYFKVHIERSVPGCSFYPYTEIDCATLALTPRRQSLVEIDGGALSKFLCYISRKHHQSSVQKALNQSMPSEVASFLCREAGVDESLPMWRLAVVDICQMASLWVQFLQSSNQTYGFKE